MKYLFLLFLVTLFSGAWGVDAVSQVKDSGKVLHGTKSGTLISEAEAEEGILSGVTIQTTQAGYSGSGYVGNFENENDQVTMSVSIPDTGLYKLVIRYGGFWGQKTQDLLLNGNFVSSVEFPGTSEFSSVDAGTYLLSKGVNTVTIKKNWGYMAVDKIEIQEADKHAFQIEKHLVDPLADAAANRLYEYLKTQFGERIIAGQTIKYFNELTSAAGNTPILKVGDMASYTEGYPYLWKDGGHTLGATDDGTVAELINWHNSTGGAGLVSLQWHWHSPSGGVAGNNNFYTENTDFDVRQAVIPGTEEYQLIIRDIDAIAVQLQRFEDAGVPVLWRPLHEAGGGWFWWGAHGPEPSLQLYNIMYERIMYHHNLHNLIWVWSTPEETWYPGNHMVDIIGYDSYPGNYNYGAQKYWFDRLYTLTNGKKLIAMTENGPIPDPDECFTMEAPWLYFMSWGDLVVQQNDTTHLQSVYSHPAVVTLESDNALWRSTLYPDTWYPGYKDSQGRYFHDFSYAGYHQGEEPIPVINENIIDVTEAPYNADNTGATDVTVILQQALDDVGVAGGGVVYLPAGKYRIRQTSSAVYADAALHMKYDSVVLRGDGPDATFIFHDQDHLRQKDIVHIRRAWVNWESSYGSMTKLRNDLMEPTRVIPVESVAGFSVGDLVVVRNDMTSAFAADHLMEGIWDNTWLDGAMFLRKIDSIDHTNGYLIVDIPTRYYLKTRDNARVYHAGDHIKECGIEDLSFGNLDNSKSGWAEEDYNTIGTGAYDVHASHVMQFKYATDCWVKNVHTYKPEENTNDIHVLSNCLVMNMCRNITVDSCDFQKPQYEGGGGNGYMFTLNGNDCLVKNSRANDSRHNYDFKLPHSNGNVLLNCRGENSKYSSDFHMYLSMANLIDGFTVNGDYLECNFRPYGGDVIHGYPSTQSVFYNTYGEAYHTSKTYIVDSRQFGWGMITGTSGPADQVKTTPVSGSQGGYTYDTSPEDYVEGVGRGADLRPVSLYLDQLERRLSGYRPAIRYFDVTVEVKDQVTGTLVEGAEVVVNDTVKQTGPDGTAFFGNVAEIVVFSVSKDNYTSYAVRTRIIHSDTIFRVELTPFYYDVTFRLLDSRTHEPFWGVNVTFSGETKVTDTEGYVTFNVPEGAHEYLIDKLSYRNESGTVSVSSDTTIVFNLERTSANMKFKLREEGTPVNKSYVAIEDDSIETNNLGIAFFTDYPIFANYYYTIRKEGYRLVEGEIALITDTTINIEMAPDTFTAVVQNHGLLARIWPNPVHDKLFCETSREMEFTFAKIYDSQGRLVDEMKIERSPFIVETKNYMPGIYLMHLIIGNQKEQHIFIKH